MSVRCPACGFDSQDGASWCEFCKEPFNKRKPALVPPAAPRLAAAPPRPEAGAELPPEVLDSLAKLDTGENIPRLPAWVRPAAWTMLGIWVFWMMVLAGYYLGKKRVLEDQPPPIPTEAPR